MRTAWLLTAAAAAAAPGIARAQQPAARVESATSPTPSLARLGVWAQQLAAAQRPVVEAYGECAPGSREVVRLMGATPVDRAAVRARIAAFKPCLDRIVQAAQTTRANLDAMQPMPAEFERALGIYTRTLLRQSAAAAEGMARYVQATADASAAMLAGDVATARAKMAEAHAVAGSAVDGQIVTLQTLRAAVPRESGKAMIDIRLAISRALRSLVTAEPAALPALIPELSGQGRDAGAAAARLRQAYREEAAPLRTLVARLDDPRRRAMLDTYDHFMAEIARLGDGVAATLTRTPDAGNLASFAAAADRLGRAEIEIMAAATRLTAAATAVR